MGNLLDGKKIAILSTDGVEQSELTEPRNALERAGAETELISPAKGEIRTMKHREKGEMFHVDIALSSADPNRYDALLLPGGVANPDELRTMPQALAFVRAIFDAGKPIAAIYHGRWMLIDFDVVHGHKFTSTPLLKGNIRNAGGTLDDREAVQNGHSTISGKPNDITAFVQEMLASFSANGECRAAW
jgi:protease I